jgi:predicted ATPase/transcriptional regulator with XRE-family HTH domain
MDERLPFGLVLKRFRLAAGLTHEALAERASLGARTISDLERGVSRVPRADTLALLVEALKLSPSQQAVLEAAARRYPDVSPGAGSRARNPNQLPLPLTSFVGRDQETPAIHRLLRRDDIRLVTLTGPGGVGKTRLALHVAAQVVDAFPDGAFAVDLASISERDSLCEAIGQAVGADQERHLPLTSLIAALEKKHLLLVLDNFEHLLPAAPMVTDLLRGCPNLKVLTTSRAALRLSGEQEFPVLPLPVPDPTHLPAIETLTDFAAVALFVDRATRVRPDFALMGHNASAIVAICAVLDGLPLAIELAAARVRTLPPSILLERLQHVSTIPTLRLLTDGPRDAPARQQTLRDTINWSHDLLDVQERALFRRLAVFVGGFTLEAAEVVCNPARESTSGDASSVVGERCYEVDVLDGLLSLVDKSLVTQGAGPDGAPRFRMLETIRAYAWGQLVASGEDVLLRRSHANYYLSLVEGTGALLFASEGKRTRLAPEQGNIQVALHWLVQHG